MFKKFALLGLLLDLTASPTLAGVQTTPGLNGTSITITADTATVGDVKYSYLTTDHGGWVKLNGRPVSSLTPAQQARATISLGIVSTLPNISDRTIIGVGGNGLGAIGGNAVLTLTQPNLPNVNLAVSNVSAGTPSGTIDNQGAHTHPYNIPYASNARFDSNQNGGSSFGSNTGYTTGSAGSHNHNFTGSTLPTHTHTVSLGGSAIPMSIQNPFLALNGFIYLGN